LVITPAIEEWTHYDVTDVNGKVTVSALKSDVNIDSRSPMRDRRSSPGQSDRVSVREGEQKSREEKCGAADIEQPGRVPGIDAVLNSAWARGLGLASSAAWLVTHFASTIRTRQSVSPSSAP